MKNITNVFTCLIILLAGVIYSPVQAQQKNGAHRANFSGEWKSNKSKSELVGKFPVCIFENDVMSSKTMKIAGYKDFLIVDVASRSPDMVLVTRQVKLIFDGKEREATYVGSIRDKSTARWSDDGQTMTVNSVRTFDRNGKTADIFDTNYKSADIKVSEVWKLINAGKSISVQVNVGENTMKLVYDKQ